MSKHLDKLKTRSITQRVERQGYYETNIGTFNKKNVMKDNPFAKRLSIDSMEMDRQLEKKLKEIWE